jgi:hypothetical protein
LPAALNFSAKRRTVEAMGERDYLKYLDELRTVRLRLRFGSVKGRLEHFVVQLEILVNGEWREVVRYDTAYGHAHRDMLDARGRKEKTVLRIHDLQSAFEYAEQDLTERWTWYRDRYLAAARRREGR